MVCLCNVVKQKKMYIVTPNKFAAVVNTVEITVCRFSSETAGGADTTVGQSQPSHSLFCDASRLGRYTRY